MILTVNIGNTHITVGGYEQDTLRFCGRLHSDMDATVDEYAIRLVNLLSLHGAVPDQIEGGILGSVVPVLSGRVLSALRILCKARILTVGPGLKSGIKLRLDNPAQLGAELLCGAVAALSECSGPLVVISADTAISMMAVNAKQELVGGVILPGPQLSLSALVKNTAQLPQIDLVAKAPASILGKSTSSCLQNGFVLGTASLLDGLAERFCAELGENFSLLNGYGVSEWNGGKVHKIYDNLYHLMRGQIYNIDGKSVFTMGGGESPDIDIRSENDGWSRDEIPSQDELLEGAKNLEKHGFSVDIVVTHEPPTRIKGFLQLKDYDMLRVTALNAYFEELSDSCKFSKWFFGSMHVDKYISGTHIAVFKNIVNAETGEKV